MCEMSATETATEAEPRRDVQIGDRLGIDCQLDERLLAFQGWLVYKFEQGKMAIQFILNLDKSRIPCAREYARVHKAHTRTSRRLSKKLQRFIREIVKKFQGVFSATNATLAQRKKHCASTFS